MTIASTPDYLAMTLMDYWRKEYEEFCILWFRDDAIQIILRTETNNFVKEVDYNNKLEGLHLPYVLAIVSTELPAARIMAITKTTSQYSKMVTIK